MTKLQPRGRGVALRRAADDENHRRIVLGPAELRHTDSAVVVQPAPAPAPATNAPSQSTTTTPTAPSPLRPRGRAAHLRRICIKHLDTQPGRNRVEYLFSPTSKIFTGEPDYEYRPWTTQRSPLIAAPPIATPCPVILPTRPARGIQEVRPTRTV